MTWEKNRILVTVKAYPERSRKHGTSVCTAGITDEGEWIRIYPITMRSFVGDNKISKYHWIEVECEKNTTEKLRRKESYRVREDTIKIVDDSLTGPKPDWKKRNEIVKPLLNSSIRELENSFQKDKTSLGLIKPKELIDFYTTEDFQLIESNKAFIRTLEGRIIPVVDEIPHIFKYRFKCQACPNDKVHNMQCEDWELFEAYRSWGKNYNNDPEITWEKMHDKFYDFMLKRDLYFMMGTESRYGRWLIIGIYYPPKVIESKTKFLTLNDFNDDAERP